MRPAPYSFGTTEKDDNLLPYIAIITYFKSGGGDNGRRRTGIETVICLRTWCKTNGTFYLIRLCIMYSSSINHIWAHSRDMHSYPVVCNIDTGEEEWGVKQLYKRVPGILRTCTQLLLPYDRQTTGDITKEGWDIREGDLKIIPSHFFLFSHCIFYL